MKTVLRERVRLTVPIGAIGRHWIARRRKTIELRQQHSGLARDKIGETAEIQESLRIDGECEPDIPLKKSATELQRMPAGDVGVVVQKLPVVAAISIIVSAAVTWQNNRVGNTA